MKQASRNEEDAHYNLPKIELKMKPRMGPALVFECKRMKIGFVFCHRRKERSIKMLGYTLPLCARCTGLWLGFGLGFFFRILGLHTSLSLTVTFMLPLVIDGLTQLLELRESNNLLRLLTGILFGIATSTLFLRIYKLVGIGS